MPSRTIQSCGLIAACPHPARGFAASRHRVFGRAALSGAGGPDSGTGQEILESNHALMAFYEGPRSKREIPDEALDIHTIRSPKLNRGIDPFFDHGAKSNNSCLSPGQAIATEIGLGGPQE